MIMTEVARSTDAENDLLILTKTTLLPLVGADLFCPFANRYL